MRTVKNGENMTKYCVGLVLAVALLPISLPAQSDGWKELFNGKDLTGWKHVGPGGDTVENGLIRTHGGMGLLYWTGGKLGDCVIRVVYKMRDSNDNSGVFIRIPIEPREEWMPVHYGYEVQIDNHPEASGEDEYHVTGTLYSLTKPLAKPGKPGPEWNTMEITLDGPHTIVDLNGVKVTDYTEGDPVPAKNSISSRSAGRARTKATSACRITATTTSCSSRKLRSNTDEMTWTANSPSREDL